MEPGPRWDNPLECTRFGDAVDVGEWSDSVEIHSNRIWECFDTGITNQGEAGSYWERNLSYHHNLIGHAEYCFEIWMHQTNTSIEHEIRIEQNVCVNSGGGWSHQQINRAGTSACSATRP